MRVSELQDPVHRLLRVLKGVTPWKRFPKDVRDWTPEQIRQRCPALELRLDSTGEPPPDPIEQTWFCYGRDAMAAWCPSWSGAHGWLVPGARTERKEAVARVLCLRATVQPGQKIITDLEDAWRARLTARGDQRPEVLVRNEWEERRHEVAPARSQIRGLMDDAISLIVRSGGQPNDASEILEDEFLHSDVVDKAIGALAPVWQTLATNTARTLSRLSAPVQISLQDHVRQAREHGMTDRATRLQLEAESRANEGLEQDLQRLVGGQSLHQTLINVAGDMAAVRDALAVGPGGAGHHAPQIDGDALAELVAEKIANKQKRGGKKGPGARKPPRGPDKTDLKLLRALERSYPGDVRFGDINIAGLTVESTIWRRLNQLREAGLASSPRRGRWRIEPAGRALIVR